MGSLDDVSLEDKERNDRLDALLGRAFRLADRLSRDALPPTLTRDIGRR
jgi:hypothetical protein